jgi:hypothetical protein
VETKGKIGARAVKFIHDHQQCAVGQSAQGVTEFDGDVGIDDLLYDPGSLIVWPFAYRPHGRDVGYEDDGLINLFQDDAGEIGTSTRFFAIMV